MKITITSETDSETVTTELDSIVAACKAFSFAENNPAIFRITHVAESDSEIHTTVYERKNKYLHKVFCKIEEKEMSIEDIISESSKKFDELVQRFQKEQNELWKESKTRLENMMRRTA